MLRKKMACGGWVQQNIFGSVDRIDHIYLFIQVY